MQIATLCGNRKQPSSSLMSYNIWQKNSLFQWIILVNVYWTSVAIMICLTKALTHLILPCHFASCLGTALPFTGVNITVTFCVIIGFYQLVLVWKNREVTAQMFPWSKKTITGFYTNSWLLWTPNSVFSALNRTGSAVYETRSKRVLMLVCIFL